MTRDQERAEVEMGKTSIIAAVLGPTVTAIQEQIDQTVTAIQGQNIGQTVTAMERVCNSGVTSIPSMFDPLRGPVYEPVDAKFYELLTANRRFYKAIFLSKTTNDRLEKLAKFHGTSPEEVISKALEVWLDAPINRIPDDQA